MYAVSTRLPSSQGVLQSLVSSPIVKRDAHFWLRGETKPNEQRTICLPHHVKSLLEGGHQVTVEESSQRCVPIEPYAELGVPIVPEGSWKTAPSDAVICGLKELPDDGEPLTHRHIYFAHCYKKQDGAAEILRRFRDGKGKLWDLEFLVDDKGKRVAAFGVSAGKNGMAMGLLIWAWQQTNLKKLAAEKEPKFRSFFETFPTFAELSAYVKTQLDQVGRLPSVILIGPRGRSGTGATAFARGLGIEPTRWGLREKRNAIPMPNVVEFDIFLNSVYIDPLNPPSPFVDFERLESPTRRLTVISDVSCDPNNPNNPIPIYDEITTLASPSRRIIQSDTKPLDVTAIDHLPSIVPEESSKEFGDALLPHLLEFDETPVWSRAEELFEKKLIEVLGGEN